MRFGTLVPLLPLLSVCSCGLPGDLGGRVTALSGTAHVYAWGAGNWEPLDTASAIGFGDSIRVGDGGMLEMELPGGTTVRLDGNTKVHIDDVEGADGVRAIEVCTHHGVVYSALEPLEETWQVYRVCTPNVLFEARGTEFTVCYELHVRTAELDVVHGEVVVVASAESPDTPPLVVPAGHFVVVPWHRAPSPPARISPVRLRRVEHLAAPSMPMRRLAGHPVRAYRPHGTGVGRVAVPRTKGVARPVPARRKSPVKSAARPRAKARPTTKRATAVKPRAVVKPRSGGVSKAPAKGGVQKKARPQAGKGAPGQKAGKTAPGQKAGKKKGKGKGPKKP